MAAKDAETWALIHAERRQSADLIGSLTPEQLRVPSLCAGWDVHTAAAHILLSAEQTPANFSRTWCATASTSTR